MKILDLNRPPITHSNLSAELWVYHLNICWFIQYRITLFLQTYLFPKLRYALKNQITFYWLFLHSTEEVFPERHPSAQGSYQEEPFINTDCCSRFDVSGVDLKQASATVNTVHTVNGVQQYTETNSDNCLLKHNHSYGTSDYKGNPNQYSCPQSELNISASYPITSIHNTTEEHASLEISSETQRALESSNSTPPSTEKTDNHCQEKSNLLLTPSHHSPLTKTTLNNQMITSNWTKSGQWNTDCSVSNHQANERQNSYCFKKDTNEHVFLDYNDANSTVIQSPDAFTDDQTGNKIYGLYFRIF